MPTQKTAPKKQAPKKQAPKKQATPKVQATRPAAPAVDDDTLPRAMGNPARSALAVVGVTTLAQATRFSTAELLAMHGVGPKAIAVLVAALSARGLSLRA